MGAREAGKSLVEALRNRRGARNDQATAQRLLGWIPTSAQDIAVGGHQLPGKNVVSHGESTYDSRNRMDTLSYNDCLNKGIQ